MGLVSVFPPGLRKPFHPGSPLPLGTQKFALFRKIFIDGNIPGLGSPAARDLHIFLFVNDNHLLVSQGFFLHLFVSSIFRLNPWKEGTSGEEDKERDKFGSQCSFGRL
jgi:hypothetical protein